MNKVKQFLKEYELLCQKYKMGLEGCGCCGSPYLTYNDKYINEINYNYKLNKIFINGDRYYHEEEERLSLKGDEKTIDEYFEEGETCYKERN